MLVAKFFIQSQSVFGPGSSRFNLSAVCRGEENRDWAAATPSGSLEAPSDPVLDAIWAAKCAGAPNAEVLVYTQPDPHGRWRLYRCEFTYGGVAVEFRRQGDASDGHAHGTFKMTVNNSDATRVLREAFASSLAKGEPSTFSLIFREPVG